MAPPITPFNPTTMTGIRPKGSTRRRRRNTKGDRRLQIEVGQRHGRSRLSGVLFSTVKSETFKLVLLKLPT